VYTYAVTQRVLPVQRKLKRKKKEKKKKRVLPSNEFSINLKERAGNLIQPSLSLFLIKMNRHDKSTNTFEFWLGLH
jgi:hypothetical protein